MEKTLLPHSDQGSTGRLQIVTATVCLTININGQKAVIDINRLAREPFWSISVWEKPEGEITLTRNEEVEEEFARFNLTIGNAVNG
jgi:hypothetical protein